MLYAPTLLETLGLLVVIGYTLSCGSPLPPDCTSPCGVELYGKADCAGLRAAEESALTAFEAHVTGWEVGRTCAALESLRVVMKVPSEVGADCREAGACYYCQARQANLIVADWAAPGFAHEVAHHLECVLHERPEYMHHEWEARHIWQAIDVAAAAMRGAPQ